MRLALALVLAGCAEAPPPVQFGPPTVPPSELAVHYDQVRERWTRHVHVSYEYFTTGLDADATLLAPEMRAAFDARMEQLRPMSDEQRKRFRDDEARFARDTVEIWIEVVTSRWEWNDLSSPRAVWRLVLTDDAGRRATPSEVQQAPVKPELALTLFPPVGPFTRTWRVRFPRWPDGTPEAAKASDDAIGGAGTRRLLLRMTGPVGDTGEKLLWEAR